MHTEMYVLTNVQEFVMAQFLWYSRVALPYKSTSLTEKNCWKSYFY